MSRLIHPVTSEQSVSEYGVRYEALRHHAMERNVPVARHGLAVLLRQGVAAWMEAWSGVPAAPVLRSPADERPCPWPDGTNAELVHLLAAMALGHIQEVAA
jgi:hypothetical protein